MTPAMARWMSPGGPRAPASRQGPPTRAIRLFGAAWRSLMCAALLSALPVSGSASGSIVLRDLRGHAQTFGAPAQRIVSLVPALTESVCALDGCDRLVGTDRHSSWPASVLALPKLGGLDDAQIERIVALRPDVVLAAPAARVIGRLESLGIRVLVLESKTHADVQRSLQVLATLLGTPAAAEPLWAAIERDVDRAAARVPPALRGQRVYFEVDTTPYAAGEGSFIGETLTRLGVANVVPAALGPFPKLNPEFIVRAQPDIVMAASAPLAEMGGRPGWDQLHALRDVRTCGFTPSRYELLVRPGPRMGEAALQIADCLVAMGRQP